MRPKWRIQILAHILKNAGYMSDLIDSILSQQTSSDIKKPETSYKTLNVSLGPGTSVMIPPEPVKPDGSVDFVISFKAIGLGDTTGASKMGTNAVVISVYLPDQTDKATGKVKFTSYRQYGQYFVNKSIGTILSVIQKKYPDKKIKKGKLAIMWWSGGYTAGQQILKEMPDEVDAVVSIDGMHAGYNIESKNRALAPFVQYAEKAKQDPSKRFVIISTGIEPPNYAGTAETAQHVAQQAGLSTTMHTPQQEYIGQKPSGISSDNGLSWVQFVPPSKKPGQYSLQQMKRQHIDVYQWGRDNINHLLGWS